MKSIQQKKAELLDEKERLQNDIESLNLRLEKVKAGIELIEKVEPLLLDEDVPINHFQASLKLSDSNGNSPFKPKGFYSIREAIIQVLKKSEKAVHLDDIITGIKDYGVDTARSTVRARLASMNGKEINRVADSTYALIKEDGAL